jgi:hypothetical protein
MAAAPQIRIPPLISPPTRCSATSNAQLTANRTPRLAFAEFGRGERSRADTFQLSVTVVRGSLGSAQIERSA